MDWIDQSEVQKKSIEKLLIDNKNRKNGFEGIYLSPGHPSVNKYLIRIFKELVDNYDIDGIHLDYIRLHDQGYGKNPYAVANFRKYNKNSKKIDVFSLDQYTNQEWNDFLRKSITALVSDTKDMITLSNPRIELSAAVKPNLYEARERFSQEWDVWLVAGYLDKAFVMNYAADLKVFAANIDIMYDNLPKKYRDRVVMGIATYNQSPQEALTKVKYTKVTRFSSLAFLLRLYLICNKS